MSFSSAQANAKYGVLIFLQAIIWGIGNPLTKIGLESITPFYCLAYRFTIASLVFLLFFGKRIRTLFTKETILPICLLCLSNAIGFIVGNIALKLTSATNVGFLSSLTVVFTPILSFFLLKMPIKKKQILIIVAVTVGLYLLCSNGGRAVLNLGDFMALACAVSSGITLTLCSKYAAKIDIAALSTLQTVFVAVMSWGFALVFENVMVYQGVTKAGWGVIFYLAIPCSCIAYLFQNTALIHLQAATVSLLLCFVPVFTAVASYYILGEVLSAQGIVGAVVIIGSLIASSVSTGTNGNMGATSDR